MNIFYLEIKMRSTDMESSKGIEALVLPYYKIHYYSNRQNIGGFSCVTFVKVEFVSLEGWAGEPR